MQDRRNSGTVPVWYTCADVSRGVFPGGFLARAPCSWSSARNAQAPPLVTDLNNLVLDITRSRCTGLPGKVTQNESGATTYNSEAVPDLVTCASTCFVQCTISATLTTLAI